LELAAKSSEYGIKPIFCNEIYHGVREKSEIKGHERDQAHLLLGALTDEGLRNLWRITDKSHTNFRFVGRATWEMLRQYNEGLFMTTACLAGLVSKEIQDGSLTALDKYLDIFGDRLYVEIHTYPTDDQRSINKSLVTIARERGLPLIHACDAHFARPDQYPEHDAYVAMQTGDTVYTPLAQRKMWHPKSLYIQSEQEVREHLSYLPDDAVEEAIQNSLDLANKCNASLPAVRRHLPVFVPSDCKFLDEEKQELSAADLLIALSVEGLYERYEDPTEEAWTRLQYELKTFIDNGLEHYFLQVYDLCRFCDEKKILRGPARGSAAGSLIVYCLGITSVDPLRYGLYFERFYNAGREKGLPDIDIDFPQRYRKTIKEYIANRWGKQKVRSIGTIMYFKPKAALNRTYKVFGIRDQDRLAINKIVSTVPDIEVVGSESIGWEDKGDKKTIYVMDYVETQINEYISAQSPEIQERLKRWLKFIANVVGRVQGYGVHASGVVISDVDLDAELPSFWSASLETMATQFPMDQVDKRGFLKDDILGLRNLDTLEEWGHLTKTDVDWRHLDIVEHPEEMWGLLEERLGLGIFQIEDENFPLALCKKLKPRSVKELSDIVALNRPGPIGAGSVDRFIRRKNGEEDIQYDHPFLEDILMDTQGEWLVQEQVIAFFNKMGYSLTDSDAVRKILGKKNPEGMKELYEGAGEWKNKGYMKIASSILGERIAQTIWDKLERFAFYSFNRAHAIGYATLGLWTLYAKWKHPKEFIIACIKTNPEDAGRYIAEARRMGIEVKPPHIVYSDVDISTYENGIYLGFSNIKGISQASAKFLISLRDEYEPRTAADLEFILEHENKLWETKRKEDSSLKPWSSPKARFKSNQIERLIRSGAFDEFEPRKTTLSQIQKDEKELLGVILTDDSEEIFRSNQALIEKCDNYDFSQGSQITIAGRVAKIRMTKVKKTGQDMAIVTVERGRDSMSFAIFPEDWRRNKFIFKEGNCAIISLQETDRGASFVGGRLLT
jgi:DNA polymerase-3 subunit alpha